MAKVWSRIRETIERHGAAGLVSVTGVAGSVPREAGARIVLQPDGGFFGTIGGGRLEYEAIASARAALASGRGAAHFRDWPLGPNLGQCCGGMVTTLTETFDANDLDVVRQFEAAEKSGVFAAISHIGDDGRIARVAATRAQPGKPAGPAMTASTKSFFKEEFGEVATPVLLFGAGHVGRALVLALAPLPFAVRWIDSRPNEFSQFVPPNVVTICTDAPDREIAAAPHGAFVIVMTHSHALDFDVTAAALKREVFDFVGLIGSDTKRARFVTWARQMGVAETEIARLVCPIGILQIKGKEPAVIAAGIAAQLLMVAEEAAAATADDAARPG
jgi:xanthine dehydrogenase accessory factor